MRFFQKLFLIITLAIIGSGIGFGQFCLASDEGNPYVVNDVAVNVSAKSPAEARNLAVKTARRDALAILFARLSVDAKMTRF